MQRYAPTPRRPFEYPVNRYYAHRVDPVLTWLADRLGLSPNTVTLLSLAAGLIATAAVFERQFAWAAVAIQLHHLLDGADGNLARARQMTSEFGRRLDIATDQIVRFCLFGSLALVAQLPAWLGVAMMATLYLDIALVAWVVRPCMQRHRLVRSRWKQWFMDRGLMPGFDIFTLYLIVSLCLLAGSPEAAVIMVTILKTIDWSYRLKECWTTMRHPHRNAPER